MVEFHLPKVAVAGSIPVSRSLVILYGYVKRQIFWIVHLTVRKVPVETVPSLKTSSKRLIPQ